MVLAYLDPGAGSLIASALVGGVAAAGVAAKQARARFAGKFSKKRAAEEPVSDETEQTEPADTTSPDA